ncbi:MAG: 50S ribosomal protein L37ae [Thermoplasmata archaeon]
MAKRTKKVGPAGRLGARYGVRIRRRIREIEVQSKGRHVCPKCKAVALLREANGIWACRHCGNRYASSSYMPTPPVSVKRELAEVLARAEGKEMPVEEELAKEAPQRPAKAEKRRKGAKE